MSGLAIVSCWAATLAPYCIPTRYDHEAAAVFVGIDVGVYVIALPLTVAGAVALVRARHALPPAAALLAIGSAVAAGIVYALDWVLAGVTLPADDGVGAHGFASQGTLLVVLALTTAGFAPFVHAGSSDRLDRPTR